jgi:hypothetical protein
MTTCFGEQQEDKIKISGYRSKETKDTKFHPNSTLLINLILSVIEVTKVL